MFSSPSSMPVTSSLSERWSKTWTLLTALASRFCVSRVVLPAKKGLPFTITSLMGLPCQVMLPPASTVMPGRRRRRSSTTAFSLTPKAAASYIIVSPFMRIGIRSPVTSMPESRKPAGYILISPRPRYWSSGPTVSGWSGRS